MKLVIKSFLTIVALSSLLLLSANFLHARDITPSVVYSQVDLISRDISLIKEHFNITDSVTQRIIKTNLKPRHVWQITYEVLVKINILRSKLQLPVIAVNSLEPVKNIPPALVYEQTQRILTELRIIRERLGIDRDVGAPILFKDKSPVDVFNSLNRISQELDIINGKSFTASHVFAQAIRILEDVNAIIDKLNVEDTTIPPGKREKTTPAHSFKTAFRLLREIQRLQMLAAIERTDFDHMRSDNVTPGDVFGLAEMILAELQTIKAYLGLKHAITPPALYYEEKKPEDVQQILGWTLRRVRLIKQLGAYK